MSQHESFLKAIRVEPNDLFHEQIYCDFLRDEGYEPPEEYLPIARLLSVAPTSLPCAKFDSFLGSGATGTAVRLDFGYDARNEQTSLTSYSDLAGTSVVGTTTYAIDEAGRTTAITNKNGSGSVLSAYTDAYDSAGRVTSEAHWSQVGTVVYSATNTYTSDSASQLTSDGAATDSDDDNGNRTSVVSAGPATATYATGSDNRVSTDGLWTDSYDLEGNQTQKVSRTSSDTWNYGYDNADRLTSVTEKSDGVHVNLAVTYAYDVLSHRVQESTWVSGGSVTVTRHSYDGRNVWVDADGSNLAQARYLYGTGANEVLTRTVGSGANAGVGSYFGDRLGSVRDVQSWASTALVDHRDQDGNITAEANPGAGDHFGFAGGWRDQFTGRIQFGIRWYDPATGSWTTQDPIRFRAGTTSLYQHVRNDPTNATDPSGLLGIFFDGTLNIAVRYMGLLDPSASYSGHTAVGIPSNVKLVHIVSAHGFSPATYPIVERAKLQVDDPKQTTLVPKSSNSTHLGVGTDTTVAGPFLAAPPGVPLPLPPVIPWATK